MGLLDLIRPLWSIFESKPTEPDPAPAAAAPATTTSSAAAEVGSGGDFLDDLEADLESSVDSAFNGDVARTTDQPPTADDGSSDDGPRELFAGIASNYSQPVKDFIFELKRGSATKEWIEITMPVMGSVIHGAESLELHEVAECMIEFREALTLAESTPGQEFSAESRQLILARFDKLVETLPDAFGSGETDQRRDGIIIHSLLRQIPDVGHVTLEKLYSSGLTSLDALFLATEHEMSVTTGVPLWLCERICRKFAEHRRQLEGGSSDADALEPRERLERIVAELRIHQQEFQRISAVGRESAELATQKRDCLRKRQACALQINVLLAEMGEIALVDELRKMGVERRIHRLDEHLASSVAANTDSMNEDMTTSQGAR